MPEIKIGSITITLADDMELPADAGTLSADALQRLRKARRDVGAVCEDTADAIEQPDSELTLPPSITSDAIRLAGRRANGADAILRDLALAYQLVSQANAIRDSEADALLGVVNDQVKAQSKQRPALETRFSAVRGYFKRGRA